MTVKELVEKLTDAVIYEKYKDCEVERAVRNADPDRVAYSTEAIGKVYMLDNVGVPEGKPLPIEYRKIVLL